MMTSRAFLFAHWEGGGNTAPVLAVIRRLVARGHRVHLLGDQCNGAEVRAAGATFAAWTRLPARPDKSAAHDPLKDWEVTSPVAMLGRLRDRMMVVPAGAYAQDVLDALRHFRADAIVTNDMLLGPMMAAERAGIPCVALSSNIYLYPLPGVPPFGPGFQPNAGIIGRLRDGLVRTMTRRVFGSGARVYNDARRDLGLEPIAHPFDQLSTVARSVVLTSAAFDFPSNALPPDVVYGGPELADPEWVEPWHSPWPRIDERPLVLVGFSTTFQNQLPVLQRLVQALGQLPVRAVVTTGTAIDGSALAARGNVHVCTSAPHNELLTQAALTITHCGHGTVIRSLVAGVPLLCMPMGRDQNDNAARVAGRGAGLRLSPGASVAAIRKAVTRLLESAEFRTRAHELGRRIAEDARRSRTVEVLEDAAGVPAPVDLGYAPSTSR